MTNTLARFIGWFRCARLTLTHYSKSFTFPRLIEFCILSIILKLKKKRYIKETSFNRALTTSVFVMFQVRNPTSAWCAAKRSPRAAIWSRICASTRVTSRSSAVCATKRSKGRSTCEDTEKDSIQRHQPSTIVPFSYPLNRTVWNTRLRFSKPPTTLSPFPVTVETLLSSPHLCLRFNLRLLCPFKRAGRYRLNGSAREFAGCNPRRRLDAQVRDLRMEEDFENGRELKRASFFISRNFD